MRIYAKDSFSGFRYHRDVGAGRGRVFHLIARLVRKQPELAVQAGEIFGLGMVVFGGYRILNALIAEAEKEEKACEKQPEEHR